MPHSHTTGAAATLAARANQSEVERFHLFDSIASFLTLVFTGSPVLVVIEDLHAADEASLLLLRVVAARLRAMNVMMVVTYRETEARLSLTLSGLLGDLGREGATISLRGLSETQVTEFVRLASDVQLGDAASHAFHVATRGNPFYLTELVRLLIAEGRLASGGLDHLVVSHSVRAAVRRRMDLVGDATRQVLRTASVVGRELELPVIRAALDLTDQQLSSAVEEALFWGLLEPMPDSITRFKFSHALIAESIYEDLDGIERKRNHLVVAETVAQLHKDELDPYLPELARHYVEALPLGDASNAAVFSERAAEFSLRRLAYEDSVKFYRMALDAIELCNPTDTRRRCVLLLGLGEAQCRARQFEAFGQTFGKAAELARQFSDGELLARAVLGSGMLLSDPNRSDPKTVKLLEEALEAIGDTESVLRARLLARLAEEIRWLPERERANVLVDEAIAIARNRRDPSTLIDALYVKLHLIRRPDNVHERLAVANEMVELVQRDGLEYSAYAAYYHRSAILLELDEIGRCRRDISAIRALPPALRAQNIGAEVVESMIALMEGRIAESDSLAERALEIGRVKPNRTARQLYNSQIFLIRREQGRIEEAIPGMRSPRSRWNAYLKANRVLYACETGRREEAQELLDDLARDNFRGVERDFLWFGTMACVAESCALLSDQDRAEVVYQILLPFESRNAAVGLYACYGPIAHYLGLLAVTLGNHEQALKHYEKAFQSSSNAGALLWLTRAEIACAAALKGRGLRDDQERAAALLERAGARAREYGMTALEVRASAVTPHPESAESRDEEKRDSVFRKEGDIWEISFDGVVTRVRDLIGLGYIAQLLRQPNVEVHALTLVVGAGAINPTDSGDGGEYLAQQSDEELAEENFRRDIPGDAGEMLDAKAKSDYGLALKEAREELEEALEFRNTERADRAREAIEALTRELARAVGRGGRDRRAGSAQERARLSVSRAIKAAIGQIADKHPVLGRHLTESIRTGLFCAYRPDPRRPIYWSF